MSSTKLAAGDPAKVAPQNYKVLLENNRMRALEYRTSREIQPRCIRIRLPHLFFCAFSHKNHDTFWYEHRFDLKAGAMMWLEPDTHSAENIGATDAHLLIVEIKGIPRRPTRSGRISATLDRD